VRAEKKGRKDRFRKKSGKRAAIWGRWELQEHPLPGWEIHYYVVGGEKKKGGGEGVVREKERRAFHPLVFGEEGSPSCRLTVGGSFFVVFCGDAIHRGKRPSEFFRNEKKRPGKVACPGGKEKEIPWKGESGRPKKAASTQIE